MADRKLNKSKGPCLMMIFLLCSIASHHVIAAPQPIPPEMSYPENFDRVLFNQMLDEEQILEREMVNERLRQIGREEGQKVKEIVKLEMEKQELEKERQPQPGSLEEDETLPETVPAAIYHTRPEHPRKRTSYMALCHFKICNMGRKRQM